MAIDSREKRASAASLPFLVLFPLANSAISTLDRIQASAVYTLPAWVSPDGHDAATYWDSETNAYDSNTATQANENDGTMQQPLVLEYDAPLFQTDHWRIIAVQISAGPTENNPDLKVEVWINGAWYEAWTGSITRNVWFDYPLGQIVPADRVRITSNSSSALDALYVNEFQMLDLDNAYWAIAKPIVDGCLVSNPLTKGGHIR